MLSAITERTTLISIMLGNNEVGSILPIGEISKKINKTGMFPMIHTDASQAFAYVDCNVSELGIDLMTLSSHKIYGPKGAGALYIKGGIKNIPLQPLIYGGGQEYSLRSGTENVPAIVGFGVAAEKVKKERTALAKKIKSLQQYCWDVIHSAMPNVKINGPPRIVTGKQIGRASCRERV